jgi:hypothetical protein
MTIFLLLIGISIESFAAIVVIRGQPTAMDYRDELYYPPQGFSISPETTNLFITMDGINKLCFLNKVPSALLQETSQINIYLNDMKTEWNCFPYTTRILEDRS